MKQSVVSFHFTLTDKAGKVLDSSKGGEALTYMEGAGQMIPAVEKELSGLKPGDKKQIQVPAADVFESPASGTDVVTFDIELTAVREATAEELSHGHAHGEHGHSH